MQLLGRIKRKLVNTFIRGRKEVAPAIAYDLWAASYDEQTGNPIVFLDDIVFTELLHNINVEGKRIIDIGCGTGRHWNKFAAKKISGITGYEVSAEMLNKLHQKYPGAQTYLLHDNKLKELQDASCDVIVSNLVIGYIQHLPEAFAEWNRVLKENGEIIITDFHPAALERGDTRSFRHNGESISIKNYIHSLDKIKQLAHQLHWEEMHSVERTVDESIQKFYEEQNALRVYQDTYHTPILYGLHFRKQEKNQSK